MSGLNKIKTDVRKVILRIIPRLTYYNLTNAITYYTKLKHLYSSKFEPTADRSIIYIADGRISHGGMADRLKGIVSLYRYSKDKGIRFGIAFSHPFQLTDYLLPNRCDWIESAERISFNPHSAKAVIIKGYHEDGWKYTDSKLGKYINQKQLHVYSNVAYSTKYFKADFEELFRPTKDLQEKISDILDKIGEPYISVTFRFQQLLGDFEEGGFQTLESDEKEVYIKKCIDAIERIKNRHNDINRVVVTSDSITFLNRVIQTLDYVYVIPGTLIHMDYTVDRQKLAYMKSFLDLFIISKARKVYNYSWNKMYAQSGFAQTAAMIGSAEYENIREA